MRSLKRFLKRIPGVTWLAARLRIWRRIGHGERAIKQMGHREYVGGHWEKKGRKQFDMMVERGLLPEHYLCDVGCGSLRGGVHFIEYLQPGHYLGIDKEQMLLDAGVEEELGREMFEEKRPELIASDSFEFGRLSTQPDYALAQSLFTHLPPPLIRVCLEKLRAAIKPDGVFLATFFETDRPIRNPGVPHDRHSFKYTREEMEEMGRETGWRAEYIGDWGHMRGQMLMRYTPDATDGGGA